MSLATLKDSKSLNTRGTHLCHWQRERTVKVLIHEELIYVIGNVKGQ